MYQGIRFVDYFNRLLMIGLGLAYVLLVGFLFPHIEDTLLSYHDAEYALLSVSLVATAFGFHIIIPTVSSYLKYQVKPLKVTLFIGSLLPLFIYLLWEMTALGIISVEGSCGLRVGFEEDANAVHLLVCHLQSGTLTLFARFFAFFSIITSFLGVTLSLSDFLSDGFHVNRRKKGWILLLTFGPPLFMVMINPKFFLIALDFVGAFGVVGLFAFFPCLMIWRGRYHKFFQSHFRVFGGKPLLIAVMSVSILIMLLEVSNKTKLTHTLITKYFGENDEN